MSSKHNILILSAGRRVELLEAFKESLAKFFPSAKVFATDIYPKISPACQLADAYFTVPKAKSEEYIDALLAICEEHDVGLVIPTIDHELNVLSENKHRFKEIGTTAVIADESLVKACRDKRDTAAVFDELGIEQPQIYNKDNLKFPCFCKPYDGSASIGAMAVFNEGMLTEEMLANERNMFLEYIGDDYHLYTIDTYYNKAGELCCVVPRQRLETRAGEVSKGITRKNYVYDYLLSRVAKLKGGMGCITFQMFGHPETHAIRAIEINPRFGGGYPLAHAAGAPFHEWLIREYFLGEEIAFSDDWEDNLLMLRYDAKVLVHDRDQ